MYREFLLWNASLYKFIKRIVKNTTSQTPEMNYNRILFRNNKLFDHNKMKKCPLLRDKSKKGFHFYSFRIIFEFHTY